MSSGPGDRRDRAAAERRPGARRPRGPRRGCRRRRTASPATLPSGRPTEHRRHARARSSCARQRVVAVQRDQQHAVDVLGAQVALARVPARALALEHEQQRGSCRSRRWQRRRRARPPEKNGSEKNRASGSETTSAIASVRRVTRLRAAWFGDVAELRDRPLDRFARSGLTRGESLITRETVARETPASLADLLERRRCSRTRDDRPRVAISRPPRPRARCAR